MPSAAEASARLPAAPAALPSLPYRASSRSLPLGLSLPLEDLACAALFAFFAMQGSIPGIAPAQAHEITGSIRTAYTTIGGISTQLAANGLLLLLLIRHPRLLLRSLTTVPLAALLALLAIASTAVSLDPLLTFRRSLPFALAGLFGFWFAARFSPRRQLSILRLALVALAVATVAMVLLDPARGLDPSPGHAADWRGIFTHKNACGRLMVLTSAAILFDETLPAVRLAPLALCLFILFRSGSRGAWVVEAALFLVWLVVLLARRSGTRFRILVAWGAPPVTAMLTAAALLLYPRLMPLLGRDATLSGRTAIWPPVLHAIALRPLLGYGYDAFWRGMQGPSLEIDRTLHFIVEHAHNGFLEIGLELGLVGMALFLLSWAAAWWRLWPLWRCGCRASTAFPLAFLLLIVLYDLDENTLLIFNGLFWPLYVASLANIRFAWSDLRHNSPHRPHAILVSQCDNCDAPASHV